MYTKLDNRVVQAHVVASNASFKNNDGRMLNFSSSRQDHVSQLRVKNMANSSVVAERLSRLNESTKLIQPKMIVAQRGGGDSGDVEKTGAEKYFLPMVGFWLTTNRAILSQSFKPYMYYAMGQAHQAGAWFNLGRNARNLAMRNPLAFGPLALGLFGMGMKWKQTGKLKPDGSTSE